MFKVFKERPFSTKLSISVALMVLLVATTMGQVITFSDQILITGRVDSPQSVLSADLDGDGDNDVLLASSLDNMIAWYENIEGQGSFGSLRVITTSAYGAKSVFSADLDGDGDLDVLSASLDDDKIAWYENIDGQGSFGPQQVITISADGAESVFSTDIDGDGDLDVLSASWVDDKIAWYENINGQGSFGPPQVITTSADGAKSVFSADLDGDGDFDVLSASRWDDKIAWYENIDGQGSFGPQQVITISADGAESVFSADLDGDGDLDVLSASWVDDKIAWYENLDGQGGFGPQQVITISADWAESVYCVDLDGDDDLDVLSASSRYNTIAWYENTDGQGSFGPQQVITSSAAGAKSVFSADLDGDGDWDVLAASSDDDMITWYENTDGQGIFGSQQLITTTAWMASSIYSADIDNDGDKDVLSASGADDKIAWYENINGQGDFGPQRVITTITDGASSVYSADLDGDGDMDVLSASINDDKIAWYENINGQGNFGPQQIITTYADYATAVFSADLDGDGDLDVLSASMVDYKIAWYENIDGHGNFGTQQVITLNAVWAYSVFSADLDGDGDLDVLSASMIDDKIAWYENTDGIGNFGIQQVISVNADGARSVFSADLDGDGDQDVLSASADDNKIAWYENTDGLGSFGFQQILTNNAFWASSVYSADLDGDGDMDVLSASNLDSKIAWYENQDGQGSFGPQQVLTYNANGASSVCSADIDSDGDWDVLSASSQDAKIAWYRNETQICQVAHVFISIIDNCIHLSWQASDYCHSWKIYRLETPYELLTEDFLIAVISGNEYYDENAIELGVGYYRVVGIGD